MTTARVDLNDNDFYTMKIVLDDKVEESKCWISIWACDEYEADAPDARLGAWIDFWGLYAIDDALDILVENTIATYGGLI